MSKGTVVITAAKLAGKAGEMLVKAGFSPVYISPANHQQFATAVQQLQAQGQTQGAPVVAIIARGVKVDGTVMDSLPALKVISRHGAGFDSIDLEAAKAKQIQVTRVSGGNARSVAELALGLMFACLRNIVPHAEATADGQWDKNQWRGEELSDKTLGLIGFGQIGNELVIMAKAIFKRVIVFDPYIDAKSIESLGIEAVSLAELQQQADVLSLHCPLTADTDKLIDATFIDGMRQGAYLINTARGGIIDEEAVIKALDSGQLAAVGLDSLQVEKPEKTALRLHEKTVITPHIGGNTEQALAIVAERSATNVIKLMNGEAILAGDIVC